MLLLQPVRGPNLKWENNYTLAVTQVFVAARATMLKYGAVDIPITDLTFLFRIRSFEQLCRCAE